MSPGDSDAKIDALIGSLEKLVQAMEKKAAKAEGSSSFDIGSGSGARDTSGWDRDKHKEAMDAIKERSAAIVREGELRIAAGEKQTVAQLHEIEMHRQIAASTFDTIEAQEADIRVKKRLHKEYAVGSTKAKQLTSNLGLIDGAFGSLVKQIPLNTQELSAFGTEMIDLVKSGELGAIMLSQMFNLAVATADAGSAFVKATGAMDDHTDVIGDVRNEYQHLGVDSAAAGAAASGLFTTMMGFSQLSKEVKTELAGQAAVIQKLGINVETTGKIFDTATKSLGFADNELVGLTEHLNDVAVSVGKGPQQVFADFAAVSKKLAFYGKDVVEVFDQLEKQSKATGLSVDELVSISGKAFDTFDGAGQKVGRLNAILGGPYLNSIDMLNASEAERLEMLTDSVEMSGQLFSDMNKYEQLAIADALGVDVDTARRMFGELSAAEELQIKHQEEIAETAKRAQTQADKLKNAFAGVFVALEPLTNTIVVVVDFLAWFIGSPGGKILLWFAMLLSAALLIAPALMGIGTAFAVVASGATAAFAAIMSPMETIKAAFKKRLGIDQMHGPELPEGGLPGAEAPDSSATSKWEAFTEGIKELGEAVKGTWKEMLAFGAAILMIGGGIAIAALGLSKLVESFQVLTGGQIVGAVLAIGLVMGGFVAILYFMIPAIAALGAVATPVSIPLIALGVAFLLMGAGVALAALGMAQLVKSFKGLNGPQLIAAGIGLGIFSAAVYFLVGAAVAATAAGWALLATAVLLTALGVAATLLGFGINLAAKGLAVLVAQLVQIPADQIFATASAATALGMSLITLGAGAIIGAIGLGVLAVALLLAAYPLIVGSTVLGIFSGVLMLVGIGMNLVAAGAESLKTSILAFVTALPQVLEFASALREIGGAAFGILKTALALGLLVPALTAFGLATKVIGLKKLEALTDFNKSATLTVDTVYKPDTNKPGREATEKAMSGKTEAAPFPWPSDERLSRAAQAKDSAVSKPVVNFSPKSIIVKIGDTELKDIVLQVLNEQVSFNSR